MFLSAIGNSLAVACRARATFPRSRVLWTSFTSFRLLSSDDKGHPKALKKELKKVGVKTPDSSGAAEYMRNELIEGRLLPPKLEVSVNLPEFVEKYGKDIENDQFLDDKVESVRGRILSKRKFGNTLVFYYLQDDGQRIQIIAKAKYHTGEMSFADLHKCMKGGDIVGFRGHPARSKYRNRALDLVMNPSVLGILDTRESIIDFIRGYLKARKFREVETPMMSYIGGGANAKEFVTHYNAINRTMTFRVAPELSLKKLVVGGMNRVFEFGRMFRNESMDHTHIPEFTSCEFYMADADYIDLMKMTDDMISRMVYSIHGTYKIPYHPNAVGKGHEYEIDFTPPFKLVNMMEGLEEALKVKFPAADKLDSPEAREFLDNLAVDHKVECAAPRTTARLLDKLVGHFLEDTFINPTFLVDYPEIMSPLAQSHRSVPGLTLRFELFAAKMELANA